MDLSVIRSNSVGAKQKLRRQLTNARTHQCREFAAAFGDTTDMVEPAAGSGQS